ncbi:hypothetical protein GHT06_007678 [Daphnia sinensis]|uniref:Transmembrane protein n=1 Tax=Daphnia sinensis TaxID=1820382 RepID=A0AAD5PXS4_9CRUS|nr:hypothetical protein GHT06_010113 [Daphnia sinensis]KAI9563941.1 hypothetical protein GHT06_007678 [Daphnia sinensis]
MKAVQSAMAIRRQRRRRDEALRAKTRRASHQSDHLMLSDSGDAGSLMSLDGAHNNRSTSHRHRQMMGGITTFHVGVVFFIMGLMLLISGIVPGYANRQHQYWEEGGASVSNSQTNNRNGPLLLVTGSFLILVGVALVIANRIATRREDELFSRYISRKLAPARMTHQPVSCLLQPSANQQQHSNHKSNGSNGKKEQTDEERVLGEEDHAVQSPGQLESITEEAEIGSERASKDQLFWTSDVAPVHHHHHHHHHHQQTKSVHQDKCDQHSHPHDNHHGSSTG